MQPKFCIECEHWHPDNASAPSFGHMCMKFPIVQGNGFVTRDKWDKDKPYRRCTDINQQGNCPLWEPKKNGQMELNDG